MHMQIYKDKVSARKYEEHTSEREGFRQKYRGAHRLRDGDLLMTNNVAVISLNLPHYIRFSIFTALISIN